LEKTERKNKIGEGFIAVVCFFQKYDRTLIKSESFRARSRLPSSMSKEFNVWGKTIKRGRVGRDADFSANDLLIEEREGSDETT